MIILFLSIVKFLNTPPPPRRIHRKLHYNMPTLLIKLARPSTKLPLIITLKNNGHTIHQIFEVWIQKINWCICNTQYTLIAENEMMSWNSMPTQMLVITPPPFPPKHLAFGTIGTTFFFSDKLAAAYTPNAAYLLFYEV
jgi:hypothetical protein